VNDHSVELGPKYEEFVYVVLNVMKIGRDGNARMGFTKLTSGKWQ